MKAKLLKRLRKEAKQTIYMVRRLTPVDCSIIAAEVEYKAEYFIVFKGKDGTIGYQCGDRGSYIHSSSYKKALELLQSRRREHILWLLGEKHVKKIDA